MSSVEAQDYWKVDANSTKLMIAYLNSIGYKCDNKSMINLPDVWKKLPFTPPFWSKDEQARKTFTRWKLSYQGIAAINNKEIIKPSSIKIDYLYPFLDKLGYGTSMIQFGVEQFERLPQASSSSKVISC